MNAVLRQWIGFLSDKFTIVMWILHVPKIRKDYAVE
jgi:hypothetical protein